MMSDWVFMEISSIHRSYLGWPIDWVNKDMLCSPNELRHRTPWSQECWYRIDVCHYCCGLVCRITLLLQLFGVVYPGTISSTHTCIYQTPCIVMLMCYTRCLLVKIRLFETYLAQHILMVALYKSTKFKLSRSVGYIELLQSKELLLGQRMAYLVITQGGIKIWNIW